MRIGEAELDEARALIDRRGHRGGAGEVADLDHDLRVADELLGDRHRLPWIGLAVLEHVLKRTALHPVMSVDLVEREIESLLPLRAILRVLAGERPLTPIVTGSPDAAWACAAAGATTARPVASRMASRKPNDVKAQTVRIMSPLLF